MVRFELFTGNISVLKMRRQRVPNLRCCDMETVDHGPQSENVAQPCHRGQQSIAERRRRRRPVRRYHVSMQLQVTATDGICHWCNFESYTLRPGSQWKVFCKRPQCLHDVQLNQTISVFSGPCIL